MARRVRLDAELVRRGLARSREQAAELGAPGRVQVAASGPKPATAVEPIRRFWCLDPDVLGYASRGGHKLAGALEAFPARSRAGECWMPVPPPAGSPTCCSAGRRGGDRRRRRLRPTGLAPAAPIRAFACIDRTNVRDLTPAPSAARSTSPSPTSRSSRSARARRRWPPARPTDLMPLVKPQFEVGREALGPAGVVHDPALRAEAERAFRGGGPTGLGRCTRGCAAGCPDRRATSSSSSVAPGDALRA